MADDKAKIVVDGDVSPLRQKLRDAARDFRQFGDEGKASVEKIGGPIEALQQKFLAIGAILAGGAVFKEAVRQTAEWTQQSVDLAAAIGESADAVSDLKAALAAEGVPVEEFVTAGQKLAAVLRQDEDSLRQVGLATRDAAGNMRPLKDLTVEAIELLGQYKAGTDRAVASDIMFGRGFKINGDLAKINTALIAEYAQKQRDLGQVLTKENVQAFEAYEQSSKDVVVTTRAISTTIGNILMPVLAKLGNWFVAAGPLAITVIKGALGGLIAAFWALKNGVVVVWETINAMVVTVAEPIRALASSLWKMAQGDFKGAWAEFGKAGETMTNAWKGALGEMEKSSRETRDKIWELFAEGDPTSGANVGGKSANGLTKKGDDKNKGKKYTDSEWALEVQAWDADRERQFNEMRAEYHEAANKAIEESDKRLLQQMNDVHALRLEGSRNADQARMDELEANARHELDMGYLTQQEYLTRLVAFNEQRLAIEERYIAAKREVAMEDPDQNVVELERIEQQKLEIRSRYAAQGASIQRQMAMESRSIWSSLTDSMSSLWDKGINAMMNGTLTWNNALRAIGAEMVRWFAVDVIGAQIKAWIAGHLKMLGIKLGFISQENAAQAAGSATTVSIKGAETAAVSSANAVQAATGAAASQAPIPIIGPMLALAAMAAIFAAVSAMGKKHKSAAKGYDIPSGVNPMTQLHEEEMVLPKQYANVIRGLAAGGGQGGQGGGEPVSIYATSDRDILRVGDLKKVLRGMGREFVDVRPL